jgi:hypothetical protein
LASWAVSLNHHQVFSIAYWHRIVDGCADLLVSRRTLFNDRLTMPCQTKAKPPKVENVFSESGMAVGFETNREVAMRFY